MERLTAKINDKVYYTKGKYPPTTICYEMDTWEVRECMQRLAEYEDTNLTPEEIQNDVRIHREMWEEKYNELKSDRDYWHNEAIKATAQLGEIKIAEEKGLLKWLPCAVGDRVYVLAECGNIERKLDGTLHDSGGGFGTATGYYCPYKDVCPHMDSEKSCDECKDITAIFEDEVSAICIDSISNITIYTENCRLGGSIGEYIFFTREEAEQVLRGGGTE